jgi:hypothetical protein
LNCVVTHLKRSGPFLFASSSGCVLSRCVAQVVANGIVGTQGIQWTAVTSVIFSSYIRIVSVWHALAYSFAVGMVVAVRWFVSPCPDFPTC